MQTAAGLHPSGPAQQVHIGPSGLAVAKAHVEDIEQGLPPIHTSTLSPGSGSHRSASLSPTSSLSPTALVSVIPSAVHSTAHAAAVAATGSEPQSVTKQQHVLQQQGGRSIRWKLVNYLIIPLALPLLAAWWLLALLLAAAATFSIWPSLLLAQRLYWACPFIPHIFNSMRGKYGLLGSWLVRLQFEGAHCMTVLARLFSAPLRPHLPHFYILGFPKCGTTSMASYLKAHPGISGLAGMPGNEVFSKESHFFGGILGRATTTSATLYRSFFPTLLTRWWAEAVLGVQQWMCFDACPTYACLPHVAARAKALTPNAKLVVMVRDPAAGVFSAETMLRNMGVPLSWTLTEPLQGAATDSGETADPRFQFAAEADRFWQQLEVLDPNELLPEDLPQRFYTELHSYLMAGRYADRLAPWLRKFGPDSILLVDYKQFVADPEATVLRVLDFLGADTALYKFQQQPARMAGNYKGACIDPGLAAWLNTTWFADSNAAIAKMLVGSKAGAAASWP